MGNASHKHHPPSHHQERYSIAIVTPNQQIQTPAEEIPAEVIDRQIEEQEQMQEEEAEQPQNVETEHAKQEIVHLQIPQNIQTNIAPVSSPRQPLTARTQLSQQVIIDREKTAKVLKDLIVEAIPVSEVKQVKISQRKKLMISWLKQGASSKKEQQRDAVLRENGYQVFSTKVLSQLYEKYEQCSRKWLKLTTLIIFSYSSYYNNQETIKQLSQYFILKGKVPKIFIVKPIDQTQYKLQFNSLKANPAISELSYQIEYIRHKIAEYQVSQPINSLNLIPLKYWEGTKGLMQIYQDGSIYEAFITKCKVSLEGCLKVGFTLVEELEEKNHFKQMLKKYAFFHDLYLNESLLMKEINKNEHFLKRIGLKLLQDPINFYLNPTHEIAINRLVKYCTDAPQCLNNAILPLNLLYYKIIEEHRKENRSKRYKNQFIGYYPAILNDEELQLLQKDTIFENLGFIKANLKQFDLKQGHFEKPANVLFIIRVHPIQREEDSDKGYVFISKSVKDVSEENEESEAYNFQGFSYVLFNLFNSFLVIEKHYDSSIKKHIIELQYGYVSAQLQQRNYVNFISQEQNVPHSLKKHHDTKIDYETIMKYESNNQILNRITDFGDCLSLLSKFNDAVSYYDSIFAKCKTEMSHDVLLLSNFQNKKGLNYQLGKSSETALQYFYNAYNFIRKSKIYTQIQLNVMRCLERSHEYQKMISFGETLIEIAKKHKFINDVSKELLLQLYQLIARGHQMKNMTNYQLKTVSKNIMKSYELGLEIVEEMGELNEIVSEFYYNLGRYYLTIHSSLESLLYLNKSLLIKKSILTQNHPSLCPLYEILAVAYVCMHDYSQALNSINSAYFLYSKYYEKTNYRFVVVYELRGKIYALLNKLPQAISSFEQEKKLLILYEQKKKFKVELERKFILKNERIALFNLIEEKQLTPYFCNSFRKDKSQIFMVYVLLYESDLYKLQYNYSTALLLLQRAHHLNVQELGQANILNLQMFFLTSDLLIESFAWEKAEIVLENFFSLLTKLRKSNEPEAARYYEQLGKLYESKKDYKNCLKNLGKAKEILFRVNGRQSLENCRISSKIGKISLFDDNLHDSKIYFSQGEKALSQMLLRLKNDPQSFNLADNDLPKFKRNVEISYSESIQNKGMLEQKSNKYDDAIKTYKEAIQSYKTNLGEYNPKVANVYFHIAQCHFNKGDLAIRESQKSLQIYKAAEDHNLNNRVDIYLLLAKLYESKNQHIISIEELGNALSCLKVMKKIGQDFHTILKEISRVIDIVISFPAINSLKNAYFIIAKFIASEKDQIAQILKMNKSAFSSRIIAQLELITQKEGSIRRLIESSETKEQKEEKMLAERLEEKDKRITLDKIKENMQIRKKLRFKTM